MIEHLAIYGARGSLERRGERFASCEVDHLEPHRSVVEAHLDRRSRPRPRWHCPARSRPDRGEDAWFGLELAQPAAATETLQAADLADPTAALLAGVPVR